MRKSQGGSKQKQVIVDKETSSFVFQITVNLEKYELDTVIETSAAFVTVAFKLGNKKIDGIEKANIIKKIAKFKNENFQMDTNFIEISQNPALYKEKKAEFIISISTSSSKSSKIETLNTFTLPFNLSSYLNNQILEKDEVLEIKASKYSGQFSFHIAFQMKFTLKPQISEIKSVANSPCLRRTKSSLNFDIEETKESPSSKNEKKVNKDNKVVLNRQSTNTRSIKSASFEVTDKFKMKKSSTNQGIPKIIVKGPPIASSIQRMMDNNPDGLESKLNSLLGSGLQTLEETDILNRKLELIALKEENSELKDEIEKLKEEKHSLLKSLSELNEEKQQWFKCFQSNQAENTIQKNISNNQHDKIASDLIETLRSFEEKFLKEETKLKLELESLKKENNLLLLENKSLLEKKTESSSEIADLKTNLIKAEEKLSGSLRENQQLQENYIKLKQDVGNILNIVLTKGSSEIMDAIEPFMK